MNLDFVMTTFLFVANKLHNLIQSKWSQDDFNREPVHVYNLRLAIKSESNVVTSEDIEKTRPAVTERRVLTLGCARIQDPDTSSHI